MSYTQKIIRNSLLALLIAPLMVLVGSLISGSLEVLAIGLITLIIALVIGIVLLVSGLIIYFGEHSTEYVRSTEAGDVLDGGAPAAEVIDHKKRARAFLLAGLLVWLVGGSVCFGSLAIEPFKLH